MRFEVTPQLEEFFDAHCDCGFVVVSGGSTDGPVEIEVLTPAAAVVAAREAWEDYGERPTLEAWVDEDSAERFSFVF